MTARGGITHNIPHEQEIVQYAIADSCNNTLENIEKIVIILQEWKLPVL